MANMKKVNVSFEMANINKLVYVAKQSQEYSVYVAKVSVSRGKNASKRKQGSG